MHKIRDSADRSSLVTAATALLSRIEIERNYIRPCAGLSGRSTESLDLPLDPSRQDWRIPRAASVGRLERREVDLAGVVQISGHGRHGVLQPGRTVIENHALVPLDPAVGERLPVAGEGRRALWTEQQALFAGDLVARRHDVPSDTAIAKPPLSRTARRIRKSPIATGTRMPAATV